ncbi:MAG: alanine--tRNA ligase [marine bacterium B5-7]|nr:MAG: alanine--tRNA ligase [marine bacterium B5-7]
MKTSDIRSLFLDYFAEQGHRIVPSSSLVPGNDPTLLFTNAGMVQFKDVFLGHEKRDYNRAVTSQRCVRAGGKHNDLENVGYTARHHTFFEMLGNFSFGDYFKREAIRFSWDFLVNKVGFEPEKLWVTVFEEDDEAASIWLDEMKVDPARFGRIGAKDNFWSMGDTGPCGPCSEIFYDHGANIPGGPPGSPDEDGDRYIEIWNLVFMQYNRSADGQMTPLPKPSVDTGMGLERLAAVLQGVHSNYEIDLFVHLIEAAAGILGIDDRDNKSLRVLSDHIRSTAFLVIDGVTPSNEGRGYVLRRIIRRAIRHGYQLGARTPFFYKMVEPLAAEMGEAYPELLASRTTVEKVLRNEEERFFETLDQGIRILDEVIVNLSGKTIPGDVVFKLYDTFGFPADLTNDVAREHGLEIDSEGFESAMDEQRQRARTASRFVMGDTLVVEGAERTPFCGYDTLEAQARIDALFRDDQPVERLEAGESGIIVLDSTPFYAESGGQVGDCGRLTGADAIIDVTCTRYLANKVIGHQGHVRMGSVKVGDTLNAAVNLSARLDTANNHSATHLLHAALITVLGDHIQQKGSLVDAEHLRFDFSHFTAVTVDELREVERIVNREIRANNEVATQQMALEDARAAGAAALFGEKYESEVRVVSMGDFSLELCGGTHVNRTGDIGLFKIVAESGVAAGIRRIEALTGQAAFEYVATRLSLLDEIGAVIKTPAEEIPARITLLNRKSRELEQQVRDLKARLASSGSSVDLTASAPEINGIRMLVSRHDEMDAKAMRTLLDNLKNKFSRAVILIGGVYDGKVLFIGGTVGDVPDVHAGNLIREVSARVEGKGGGRADMAQGGGTATSNIDDALGYAIKALTATLQND